MKTAGSIFMIDLQSVQFLIISKCNPPKELKAFMIFYEAISQFIITAIESVSRSTSVINDYKFILYQLITIHMNLYQYHRAVQHCIITLLKTDLNF